MEIVRMNNILKDQWKPLKPTSRRPWAAVFGPVPDPPENSRLACSQSVFDDSQAERLLISASSSARLRHFQCSGEESKTPFCKNSPRTPIGRASSHLPSPDTPSPRHLSCAVWVQLG